MTNPARPDYGVDAPNVLRGLLLWGAACLLVYASLQATGRANGLVFPVGKVTLTFPKNMFLGTGAVLFVEGLLFLLYVKYGKFRHRDAMLAMHAWTGNERVLDVGCGRGLLLAGAAKRIAEHVGEGDASGSAGGRATGIDIWSNVDMGGNSAAATQRNLDLEGVAGICDLQSMPAQTMTFPDASFDVVVSNLCLHNIPKAQDRAKACREIVRVLKPGGQALVSDYRRTGEYARVFQEGGCEVRKKWGSFLTTFPPLRTVIVRKPA